LTILKLRHGWIVHSTYWLLGIIYLIYASIKLFEFLEIPIHDCRNSSSLHQFPISFLMRTWIWDVFRYHHVSIRFTTRGNMYILIIWCNSFSCLHWHEFGRRCIIMVVLNFNFLRFNLNMDASSFIITDSCYRWGFSWVLTQKWWSFAFLIENTQEGQVPLTATGMIIIIHLLHFIFIATILKL
jgi:hypothetical protein